MIVYWFFYKNKIFVKLGLKSVIQFSSGFIKKWLGPESNQRHKDFQSSALPTELPSHVRVGYALKKRRKITGAFYQNKLKNLGMNYLLFHPCITYRFLVIFRWCFIDHVPSENFSFSNS